MAGDLSASNILKLRAKAENAWSDGKTASQYKVNAEAAKAVLENQTAQIDLLTGRANKDDIVEITFINTCGVVAEDCESNCTIDEPELDTGKEEYAVDICKKTGFSIDAEKVRTNDYELEQLHTAGHAAAVKALDEFWAAQVLAKLDAESGYNAYPTPYAFDPATMVATVPAAGYNLNQLTANLILQAQMNNINMPYYIERGLLAGEFLNVQFNAGNFDGKGDAARAQFLKMYFDMLNFAKAGVTDTDLFMIDASAVALATKTRYSSTPVLAGGKIQQTRYTVPSQALPGVSYDVIYSLECKTVGTKAHDVHSWRYETNGLIAINPALCPVTVGEATYDSNGILAYKRGA